MEIGLGLPCQMTLSTYERSYNTCFSLPCCHCSIEWEVDLSFAAFPKHLTSLWSSLRQSVCSAQSQDSSAHNGRIKSSSNLSQQDFVGGYSDKMLLVVSASRKILSEKTWALSSEYWHLPSSQASLSKRCPGMPFFFLAV